MSAPTPLALQAPTAAARFRPARPADLDALHAACWPDQPRERVARLLDRARRIASDGRGLGVVALRDGHIIGYGQVMLWARCAEISDLMITPAQRGGGTGTALIQYLCRVARDLHTGCIEIGAETGNTRALALYRRLGFVDTHTVEIDRDDGDPLTVTYLRLDLTPS